MGSKILQERNSSADGILLLDIPDYLFVTLARSISKVAGHWKINSGDSLKEGKMKKWSLLVMFLLGASFFAPVPSLAGQNLDLGDAIGGPPDVPQRMILEYFCSEVLKRSNGEITIKYHPQTIVTTETKAVEMTKMGSLAFCAIGGAAGTMFPNTQPLQMPYLIRDYAHYFALVKSPIVKAMEEEIEKKHNLKVVFWFDWGFRQFVTSKKVINKVEDLRGLKLRVQPSPPLADMMNAFGASAVPISWSEAIPAVQQGVVDGMDVPVTTIIKFKIYEITKYAAITNHYFTATPLLVNLKIWKGFTADQQKMMTQVGQEAANKEREMMEKADADGKGTMERYGMQVTTPDLNPFRKIAQEKVYPKYYDKFGKEAFDKIWAVK
jgi:tripartite ATP-independent transporter DctP family solute receptor